MDLPALVDVDALEDLLDLLLVVVSDAPQGRLKLLQLDGAVVRGVVSVEGLPQLR